MKWYAAHMVFYVKLKGKRQTRYPVWENIVLISGRNADEAWDKAEKRALEDPCMCTDESFTWGGVPAEWAFGGIRKLTRCVDEKVRPASGTEITFIEFELGSKADLEKYIDGKPVTLRIDDGSIEAETTERVPIAANGR
jgi:hypothetical protein